jgi:hypothetical protein
MIPTVELDLFTDVLEDAIHLAAQGQLSDGYTGLLVGVERAIDLHLAGEPWARDLLARWRAACADYAQAFGVPLS